MVDSQGCNYMADLAEVVPPELIKARLHLVDDVIAGLPKTKTPVIG